MCINRSQRHCCLQATLIFLLIIFVITFGAIIAIYLGVYYSTEQTISLRQQRNVFNVNDNSNNPSSLSSSSSSSLSSLIINKLIKKRSTDNNNEESFNEKLATTFFKRNCPWNQWIVQSSILLDLCPYVDSFSDGGGSKMSLNTMNDVQFKNCLRDSFWYLAIGSIIPFILTFITLIAVCRLWLCPIITMAIIYLALAILLIIFTIIYKSGIILTDGWPLFIGVAILICIYALLSLLLILLFSLIAYEQCKRGQRQQKRNGTNGTNNNNNNNNNVNNDHRMLRSINDDDDDDELDDPNIPLYHKKVNNNNNNNNYSQQKRTDFDDKIKDFKYIDDDMSYVYRRG